MSVPQATPIRGEIERALRGRGGIRIAATAKYLATQLKVPLRAMTAQLDMMARENVLAAKAIPEGMLYRIATTE